MSHFPPPPAAGAPQPGGAVPQDHPKAGTALVVGIVSLVCCQVLGIPAYLMGRNAEREIKASGGRYGGEAKASTAKLLGIISMALLALGVIALLMLVAAGVAMETLVRQSRGGLG